MPAPILRSPGTLIAFFETVCAAISRRRHVGRERYTVGSASKGIFKKLRPGLVFEVTGPSSSGYGEIVDISPTYLTARITLRGAAAGRVFVRIPLEGGVITFSAGMAAFPDPTGDLVRLDDFSNVAFSDRRTAARLHEPIRVTIRSGLDAQQFRVLPALNISSRGLLLGWPGTPDAVLGERLNLTLTLSGEDYAVSGDVVRVLPEQTAVRFVSPSDTARAAIIAYVYRRQFERKKVDDPFLDME